MEMERIEAPAEAVEALPPAVARLQLLTLQHPMHQHAKQQIREFHARALSRLQGHALPAEALFILGETRVGKSWVLRDYQARFPIVSKESVKAGGPPLPPGIHHSLDDSDYRPIVFTSVASNADLRTFVSGILGAFGYKTRDTWDTPAIIERIVWYVRQMGTQMIFIDEGHNLFSRRDEMSTADVVEFLKQLLNEVPCEFVIAGLPELRGVKKFAPQLRGRLEAPVFIRPYSWGVPRELKIFVGLLRRFEREFDLPEASAIHEFDMARRLYVAAFDGRIGWVVKLLSRALRKAVERGLPKLDKDLLGEVFADFDLDEEGVPGPGNGLLPDDAFTNEDAFAQALATADLTPPKSPLPAELNPFLCEPGQLREIGRRMQERLDLERRDLAGKLGDVGRKTKLKPEAETAVGAFGRS